MTICLAAALLSTGIASAAVEELPPPKLESGLKAGDKATGGFYHLKWELPAKDREGQKYPQLSEKQRNQLVFELQRSRSQGFSDASTIYKGQDTATVVSGQKDGVYHYRIRAAINGTVSPWSKTKAVEVKHHSLSRAFAFFFTGMVVFLLIVATIFHGSRRTSTET